MERNLASLRLHRLNLRENNEQNVVGIEADYCVPASP
jgi:hypothetical protein